MDALNQADEKFEERENERARKEAQIMDSYNLRKRSQSLMEKHNSVETSAGGKKKLKKIKEALSSRFRGSTNNEARKFL